MCTTGQLQTDFFNLPVWITARVRYNKQSEIEPSYIEEAGIRFNPEHSDSFVVAIQLNTLHRRYCEKLLEGFRKRRKEWLEEFADLSNTSGVDLAAGIAGMLAGD